MIFTWTTCETLGFWRALVTKLSDRFVHLHVHSNFSFMDGAAHLHQLIDKAKELGMSALALTDHNGLYGAIRFYRIARAQGVKPIIGAELTLKNGSHLVLLAKNRAGYSNLCKIITEQHLNSCTYETLSRYADNLVALSGCCRGSVASHILRAPARARNAALEMAAIFGPENFYIELQRHLLPGDGKRNAMLTALAAELGLSVVATNNVHYANKEDHRLHDVLAAAGARHSLDELAPRGNAELYLKTALQMAVLFASYPQAFPNTVKIADECNLELELGTFHFPGYELPKGETSYSLLCKLSFAGAKKAYRPLTPAVLERLEHELALIEKMGFAQYFLVVRDIAQFAKKRGIYHSGRGSAADSIISYVLNITAADPIAHDLLFERFLNPARREMPDIDIDFCSRRRDEVIEYIYERFGQDHVATVATVNTLTAKSAIRVAAKAFGFSPTEINGLSRHFPWVKAATIRQALGEYPELKNSPLQGEEFGPLIEIAEKLGGFPRHLGTHLGGFIITPEPITDHTPLQRAAKGVLVSQYDKDDIGALGLVKMDILGLRMHSAMAEAAALIGKRTGRAIDPYNLPANDKPTYELIKSADTVGVFQLESSGQRNLAWRFRQETFTDIIAAISLFRPGPMEAQMITPFIRRRHGLERAVVCHPDLAPILKDTYGVILYQEQVLQIASAIAGFSLAEADLLRRAMTKDRSSQQIEKLAGLFVKKAIGKGASKRVAEDIWGQLRGFAAYGFCKAHAACFAVISYGSAYFKHHFPAEFYAGILNNQPMGFYTPRVVLNDARRAGLEVLPLDINSSSAGFRVVRAGGALQPGFSYVRQLSSALLSNVIKERDRERFSSFDDFFRRVRPDVAAAANLIKVGAFDSLGSGRDQLLTALPLMRHEGRNNGSQKAIITWRPSPTDGKPWNLPKKLGAELEVLGLNVSSHPLRAGRGKLRDRGVVFSSELAALPDNTKVKVVGIYERRQTPPTKSGQRTMFLTLEDEEGLLDIVIFASKLKEYGAVLVENHLFLVEGRLQNNQQHGLAIVAEKITAYCN